MANITTPANIPAAAKPDIKAVCAAIGPNVLGDKWPAEITDPAAMTPAQVGQVFEAVTREFWRQQVQALKANLAAEEARQAALTTSVADPFA